MPQPTLTAETRDLIAAVVETLAIPYAATVGHEKTRAKILDERVMQLFVALKPLTSAADVTVERLAWVLDYLREKLAEHPPVGYVTDEQARARCDAGATWPDAVRLDYPGPGADDVATVNVTVANPVDDAEVRERAARRATWPGGEPSDVRAAADVAPPADSATPANAAAPPEEPTSSEETGSEDIAGDSSNDDDDGADEDECAAWCDGQHRPLFDVAGETEPPRCFREIGRTSGGEGQLVVGLADDDGWPHVEVLHTNDTGRDVEELRAGDIWLLPDRAAALASILGRAHAALTAATTDPTQNLETR